MATIIRAMTIAAVTTRSMRLIKPHPYPRRSGLCGRPAELYNAITVTSIRCYTYPHASPIDYLCMPGGYFWVRTSENSVMKLSEKSWRCPNRGLTRVRMGTFRHRTPAKPALGGLLKPLFRQFHGEVRRIPLPRTRVNSALEELEDGLVDRGVPFDS